VKKGEGCEFEDSSNSMSAATPTPSAKKVMGKGSQDEKARGERSVFEQKHQVVIRLSVVLGVYHGDRTGGQR